MISKLGRFCYAVDAWLPCVPNSVMAIFVWVILSHWTYAQFLPDYGEALWQLTRPMPAGQVAKEGNVSPKVDIEIKSATAAVLTEAGAPAIAANPGKNFAVTLNVEFKTNEDTKLFANLRLDPILPDAEKQKLMQWHSMTWHFDNDSSPGARPISQPGSQQITLIGTAPKELGEFDFEIDVGLMPKKSGGMLRKNYPVKLVTKFPKPEPLQPNAVALHAASQRVAVGGIDGKVRILDARDGKYLHVWPAGNWPIHAVAFSVDGQQLAIGFGPSAPDDKALKPIKILAADSGAGVKELTGHAVRVNSLNYTPDNHLISCGTDGRVVLWNPTDGLELAAYKADGTTSGMSYCPKSNTVCVVVNNDLITRQNAETRTRSVTVTKCRTETRQRTFQQQSMQLQQRSQVLPVDFEGVLRQVKQDKTVMVPIFETRTQDYTVSVPYTEMVEQSYTVMVPVVEHWGHHADKPASVLQLALPQLTPTGRWTPEGERLPIGTSFNRDGNRIFVTTPAGISVLESSSMLELVDLRERTAKGTDATTPIHHLSPFYLANHDAVITPNSTELVTLKSSLKTDDAYFQSLSQSAKRYQQRSQELARQAQTSGPPNLPYAPPPSAQPSAPKAPKLVAKPLLAKLAADQSEILLTKTNFNPLGVEEFFEAAPKAYWLGGFEHHDALAASAPHSTVFNIPEGFSTFTTMFGLQDKQSGSISFVIRGDGRSLYRSSIIRDHMIHGITIDVRGIKQLELAVEPADKGNQGDKALWVDPTLSKKVDASAYAMKYVELRLKVKELEPTVLVFDNTNAEIFSLSRDHEKAEVQLDNQAWKIKESPSIALPWKNQKLDFSLARVHIQQCELGNLSYQREADKLLIQFTPYEFRRLNSECILQIPIASNPTPSDHEPAWTGPWKVAGWKPERPLDWNALPAVPPPTVKYYAATTSPGIDWTWGQLPPLKDCPETHGVIVGERKFQSLGGVYRLETLADDGIRIKLDGEIILEQWQPENARQTCRLISIAPGNHTLRFEHADTISDKRIYVNLRTQGQSTQPEPAAAKAADKPKDRAADKPKGFIAPIDAWRQLRELGVYVQCDLAAPDATSLVYLDRLLKPQSDKAIKILSRLPGPRAVHVSGPEISEAEVSYIANNANLERLSIQYANLTPATAKEIVKSKSLKRLTIFGGKLTPEIMQELARSTSVENVLVWYNDSLTDDLLLELQKLRSLKWLGAFQCKCTLAGFYELRSKRRELRCEHDVRAQSSEVSIGGKRYVLVSTPTKYDDAAKLAQSLGGSLPVPASAQENEQLATIAENFGVHNAIWLGVSDAAQEGNWVGPTNQKIAYTAWAPSEPNGNRNENFGTLLVDKRQWNDSHLDVQNPFLVVLEK